MVNTMNDQSKHIEVLAEYFQALVGDRHLDDVSALELVDILSKQVHGLNGGSTLSIGAASEVVGFDPETHVVRTGEDTWGVMVMVEFDDSEEAMRKYIEDDGWEIQLDTVH